MHQILLHKFAHVFTANFVTFSKAPQLKILSGGAVAIDALLSVYDAHLDRLGHRLCAVDGSQFLDRRGQMMVHRVL